MASPKTAVVATRLPLHLRKELRQAAAENDQNLAQYIEETLKRRLRARRRASAARATARESGDGPFVASTPGIAEGAVVGTTPSLADSTMKDLK